MPDKETQQTLYEWTFATLAVIAVVLAIHEFWPWWYDVPWLTWLDNGILLVFVADYGVRVVRAPKKWTFIRSHPWDLLSIVPGHSAMRGFRLFRLTRFARTLRIVRGLRLLRAIALFRRAYPSLQQFLKTNGLGYVLCFTGGLVAVGAVGIYLTESRNEIANFGDALWWSFVTTTTVGTVSARIRYLVFNMTAWETAKSQQTGFCDSHQELQGFRIAALTVVTFRRAPVSDG